MAEAKCKYYKQKKQVSYDNGVTWADVIPYEYQQGGLYERASKSCGGYLLYRGTYGDKVLKEYYYDGCGCCPPGECNIVITETNYVEGPPKSGLTSVVIGFFVDTIFAGTFDYCTNLKRINSDIDGVANIPNSVINIGGGAFRACTSLTSVRLPNELTNLEGYTFSHCDSLTSVTIPDSVKYIGSYAFNACSSLTSVGPKGSGASVEIPSGVTEILDGTFAYCDSLTSVTIPDSVTSISEKGDENGAFAYCSSLTSVGPKGSGASVEIPSSVSTINDLTFNECTNLTSVIIPDTVMYIGDNAFYDCIGLTSVAIGSGVTHIGDEAFNYFYNDDIVEIKSIVINAINPPSIPNNSHTIFPNSKWDRLNCPIFVPCESINTYKVQNEWQRYASRIFGISPCGIYRWLNIDPIIDYYCEGNTKYFKQQKEVSYDNGLTWQYIIPYEYQKGEVAEECSVGCGCESPDAKIKFAAIYSDGSKYVLECNDSSTLTSFETNPSGYERSAMTSAVIGDCVTNIGNNAFKNCSGLTNLTIPDSVTNISDNAFNNCSGLTSVEIGSGVTAIGNGAFSGCSSLRHITIPDSVTSIGDSAFWGCFELITITIGSGITYIGDLAFKFCRKVRSMFISATTPPTVKSWETFDYTSMRYYVPCESLEAYKATDVWKTKSIYCQPEAIYRWLNINPSISYYCEGTTKYVKQQKEVSYDNGITWADVIPYEYQKGEVLEEMSIDCSSTYRWANLDPTTEYYCSGTTKMYKQQKQYSTDGGSTWHNVVPLEYREGGVAETNSTDCGYVFGGKLVAIYSDGRTNEVECNSNTELTSGETNPSGYVVSAMTSAVIGDCVTSIGWYAFSGCSNLSSIEISSGVTTIGNSAFFDCSSLTSVNIPDSVTSIGGYAFSNCSSLTSVTIGSGVTNIYRLAFASCRSLISVTIPNNVTDIWDYAFNHCRSLTSITCLATTPPFLASNVFDDTNNCPIYVPAESVDAYKTATNWSRYASRITCVPTFEGKWLATYSNGDTSSAECDSSSAITSGEITKENLVQIEIGDCVTSIGYNAFSHCGSLRNATIGENVTSIGSNAFYDCYSLESITCHATTPPAFGSNMLSSTNNCPIYVPEESVNTYKAAIGWRDYASRIQPIT